MSFTDPRFWRRPRLARLPRRSGGRAGAVTSESRGSEPLKQNVAFGRPLAGVSPTFPDDARRRRRARAPRSTAELTRAATAAHVPWPRFRKHLVKGCRSTPASAARRRTRRRRRLAAVERRVRRAGVVRRAARVGRRAGRRRRRDDGGVRSSALQIPAAPSLCERDAVERLPPLARARRRRSLLRRHRGELSTAALFRHAGRGRASRVKLYRSLARRRRCSTSSARSPRRARQRPRGCRASRSQPAARRRAACACSAALRGGRSRSRAAGPALLAVGPPPADERPISSRRASATSARRRAVLPGRVARTHGGAAAGRQLRDRQGLSSRSLHATSVRGGRLTLAGSTLRAGAAILRPLILGPRAKDVAADAAADASSASTPSSSSSSPQPPPPRASVASASARVTSCASSSARSSARRAQLAHPPATRGVASWSKDS